MQTQEIIDAIDSGDLDAALSSIENAIRNRRQNRRSSATLEMFHVGDAVMFNDQCGTAYLRGAKAVVVGRGRTKLQVKLERPVGRFVSSTGESKVITAPISIVDLV